MPRRRFRSSRSRSAFPFAGCVSYRGFFSEEEARRHAERLREEGNDVYVGGVPAYSTLGWFDDPLLSTFIRYPDVQLARLMFHELAHQRVYVKDDTTFNESFAVAVEEEGVRRWLEAEGRGGELAALRAAQAAQAGVRARAWRRRASASQASTRKLPREEKLSIRRRSGERLRARLPDAAGRAEQRVPGLDRGLHRAGAGLRAAARGKRRPEEFYRAREGAGGAKPADARGASLTTAGCRRSS